jgi:hypothetical protein
MGSLTNVLAGIPGYAGYIGAQQVGQEREMGQLQQAGALMQIRAQIEGQNRAAAELQRNEALRQAVSALPPDQRTRENVLPLLLEHGNVKELVPLLKSKDEEKPTPIGAGGLRLPDGTVVPPAGLERKPAATRQRYDGANVVQEEMQPDGSWKEIGRGPRFAPEKEQKPAPGYRWTKDGGQEAIPGGPADLKAQATAQRAADGATDVDVAIGTLRDAYDRLEKGGGITSTKNEGLDNLPAAVSASGLGQAVGKMFGTQNQSARNDIAMARPALLASLMKATGMSAKQMDSNAELKLWLATATDPTLDVESNRRALENIEKKYMRNQPSGGAPTPPSFKEGQTATNAQGVKIIFQGGAWRPVGGR